MTREDSRADTGSEASWYPPRSLATRAVRMLVERDRELAKVDGLLTRVTAESGTTLLIEGAPGIGKTALLAEVQSRAAGAGFRVLQALGGELEQKLSFGIVRQLLEPLLRAADPQARADLLSG